MKKLFENVGGNQFKLLTENVENSELIRSGLKKVFSSGSPEISYSHLANIGLGYIRNVSEARKCALREAQELAPEFGYQDDEPNQKFIKEIDLVPDKYQDSVIEKDPEERREVQIAKEMLRVSQWAGTTNNQQAWDIVEELAKELLKMHGAK